MSNDLTRRSFVKWGAAAAGAATLAGFTGCAPSGQENAQKEMARRANDIAIVSKRSVRKKGRSHFTKVLKRRKRKNKMSWRKQLCQKAREN